jgi:hypothetical protein
MRQSAVPLVGALLLLHCAVAVVQPQCGSDLLCSARLDDGLLVESPPNNTVFKIFVWGPIESKELSTRNEFISFFVVFNGTDSDDVNRTNVWSSDVSIHFECGERIDGVNGSCFKSAEETPSWCEGISFPSHSLFQGMQCQPGYINNMNIGGGLKAHLMTLSINPDPNIKGDSGAMRDDKSRVCFWASNRKTGAQGGKRCIFLRAITRPNNFDIYASSGGNVTKKEDTKKILISYVGNRRDVEPPMTVGFDLHIELRARTSSPVSRVDIDSAKSLNELFQQDFTGLPGQRWVGPTTCRSTGLQQGPCSEWSRTLIYRPTAEEKGEQYGINFQAATRFPEEHAFSAWGTPEMGYAGVSCKGGLGPCPNSTDPRAAKFLVDGQQETVTVLVQEFVPAFRYEELDHKKAIGKEGGWLLEAGEVSAGVHEVDSALGPLTQCSEAKVSGIKLDDCIGTGSIVGQTQPHPAYVNCPMKSLSFVAAYAPCLQDPKPDICGGADEISSCASAAQIGAVTELEFVVQSARSRSAAGMDARNLGLELSQRLYIAETREKSDCDDCAIVGGLVCVCARARTRMHVCTHARDACARDAWSGA